VIPPALQASRQEWPYYIREIGAGLPRI